MKQSKAFPFLKALLDALIEVAPGWTKAPGKFVSSLVEQLKSQSEEEAKQLELEIKSISKDELEAIIKEAGCKERENIELIAGVVKLIPDSFKRIDYKLDRIEKVLNELIKSKGLLETTSTLERLCNWILEYLSATIFASINRKEYLRKLIVHHKEFSLLGRAKPLELEKIYVALRIGEHVPPDYKPDKQDEQSFPKATHTLEVKDALLISRRLVILGGPGSGKTTLLRYLALQVAKKNKMLADFSLKLIPTQTTRILQTIHRVLSGFDNLFIGFLSIFVFLIVGLVSAWKISGSWMAAFYSLVIFLSMFLIVVRVAREVIFIPSILTLCILSLFTLYSFFTSSSILPFLPLPTLIAGWITLGIILYPFWIQLPLTLVSFLLDQATHYPLPIYLTLNNLIDDEQDIEAHLKDPNGFA